MFVDVCCGIVEELGMDTVGIYRVPGNTAGVSFLQELLKAGPEEADFTDSVSRNTSSPDRCDLGYHKTLSQDQLRITGLNND